jgi:hypothetical protein
MRRRLQGDNAMSAIPKQIEIDDDMQKLIAERIESLEQAHANNLIEGLDVGDEIFADMLERARQPISDEEFSRREKEITRRMFMVEPAQN